MDAVYSDTRQTCHAYKVLTVNYRRKNSTKHLSPRDLFWLLGCTGLPLSSTTPRRVKFMVRSIDFDTQVVPILLPVHLAVSDIEEIFYTQFLATRHLDESDSSWYVLLLRHPVRYDVVRGRPGKVPVGRKWPFLHNQSNTILYTS